MNRLHVGTTDSILNRALLHADVDNPGSAYNGLIPTHVLLTVEEHDALVRGALARVIRSSEPPVPPVPRYRTGVIVGAGATATPESLVRCAEELRAIFPDVTLAVVNGVHSVAFEWEDPA